jgi:two-component system, chemotaxis family, sensor kinase CheA
LAGEITRRLQLLSDPNPSQLEVRAALHSLKGSAGMAGCTELSLVIAQCAQRVQAELPRALADTRLMLEHARDRLSQDLPPFASVWPEPPAFLGPSRIDAKYHIQYYAAIRERLGELDSVLSTTGEAQVGLERAQRAVHAMKGAAAALGDDVTAWYCHGLEAALRRVPRAAIEATDALVDLARHRALFTLLLEDQARGLETLRALAQSRVLAPTTTAQPQSRPRTRAPSHPPSRPPSGEFQLHNDASLQVPVGTLDSFSERLERIDLVHDELLRSGDLARQLATRLRATSVGLNEARRALNSVESQGSGLLRIELASAQLRTSAVNAERGAGIFRRNAEFLRARTGEMRSELGALRRASLHSLFESVKRATMRDAEHERKAIAVEISGPDVPIDRRISERLFDTVLQLSKNALVHGLESPAERARAGKAPVGRVTLSAEQMGEWLRITVSDDGRGADVARIRELAIAAGAVTPSAAERAAEDDLLALLFLPGLTTHQRANLLAGRGLGLDLVQDTVRRLGGSIRLRSRVGGGLTASFELPTDQTVVEVLWLEELGQRFALPVTFTGRVEASDSSRPPPVRLARCLGQKCAANAAVSLELTVYGVTPISIGVDAVGEIEQVALRALPALIAERGPYGGAVLRSDGTLHLALDAPLVAARAWTLRTPQPQDAA